MFGMGGKKKVSATNNSVSNTNTNIVPKDYTCVARFQDNRGNYVFYILEDKTGKTEEFTSNELKSALSFGKDAKIRICNLNYDKDSRLVPVTVNGVAPIYNGVLQDRLYKPYIYWLLLNTHIISVLNDFIISNNSLGKDTFEFYCLQFYLYEQKQKENTFWLDYWNFNTPNMITKSSYELLRTESMKKLSKLLITNIFYYLNLNKAKIGSKYYMLLNKKEADSLDLVKRHHNNMLLGEFIDMNTIQYVFTNNIFVTEYVRQRHLENQVYILWVTVSGEGPAGSSSAIGETGADKSQPNNIKLLSPKKMQITRVYEKVGVCGIDYDFAFVANIF